MKRFPPPFYNRRAMEAYVAHTHREWFDFLSTHARDGRLDEVNFWFPNSPRPPKKFEIAEPVFFRLGAPERKIAGCGFFATFQVVDLGLAWETFGFRNGAPDRSTFYRLLGRRTAEDLRKPVGCMILRDARFWPDHRWIPWGTERGHADTGIQRGRTETDPANVARLFDELRRDDVAPPPDLLEEFEPLHVDERMLVSRPRVEREGQGTFRLRLLDAYGRQCAITGEHTEPVLDAAHIQDYLGPKSNHVRNGMVLTKEFHALFDRGLVTVEPPTRAKPDLYVVRVSRLIHDRWNNGKRYLEHDGKPLKAVPANPALRPSTAALEWHREVKFERVA